MTDLIFPTPAPVTLAIYGRAARFPLRRIFCVGRNYVEHAREMGGEVDREAPFYFTKSPLAVAPSGTTLPYPPGTSDLHHEVELVVALGGPAFRIAESAAQGVVWGYGVGLDMTRRDLQAEAKDKRRPWDTAKDFEGAAIIGALTPAAGPMAGEILGQAITLAVNGETRQSAWLSDMVWPVPSLIAHLSTLYHLDAGDLIFTGTPAGVGAVLPGDRIEGRIEGLEPVVLTITDPEVPAPG